MVICRTFAGSCGGTNPSMGAKIPPWGLYGLYGKGKNYVEKSHSKLHRCLQSKFQFIFVRQRSDLCGTPNGPTTPQSANLSFCGTFSGICGGKNPSMGANFDFWGLYGKGKNYIEKSYSELHRCLRSKFQFIFFDREATSAVLQLVLQIT